MKMNCFIQTKNLFQSLDNSRVEDAGIFHTLGVVYQVFGRKSGLQRIVGRLVLGSGCVDERANICNRVRVVERACGSEKQWNGRDCPKGIISPFDWRRGREMPRS